MPRHRLNVACVLFGLLTLWGAVGLNSDLQAYDEVCECQGPFPHRRTELGTVDCLYICGGPEDRFFEANFCFFTAICKECLGTGGFPRWCTVNECGIFSLQTVICPRISLE